MGHGEIKANTLLFVKSRVEHLWRGAERASKDGFAQIVEPSYKLPAAAIPFCTERKHWDWGKHKLSQ